MSAIQNWTRYDMLWYLNVLKELDKNSDDLGELWIISWRLSSLGKGMPRNSWVLIFQRQRLIFYTWCKIANNPSTPSYVGINIQTDRTAWYTETLPLYLTNNRGNSHSHCSLLCGKTPLQHTLFQSSPPV